MAVVLTHSRADEYASWDDIVLDCIPKRPITLPELNEKLAEAERRLGVVMTADPIAIITRLVKAGKVSAHSHSKTIRKV